jgi:uncharacterized protein
MSKNPFVYGEVVPAAAFVDRIDELTRLTRDLLSGQKVFLISPRRYGKSSLIRQALRGATRDGAIAVEVTVSSFSSYVAFLEGYARAVIGAQTRWASARAWLMDAIRSTRPEIRLDPDARGELAVAFPGVRSERDAAKLAVDVFTLPARLAAEHRRHVVVALDEFQAIASFDGGSVEHALRAAIQHQRDVGYVFAGSEPSLMDRMIGPKRPFYKAGPVMRLGRIPSDLFAAFIESRFTRTGIRAEPGLGAAVVELAGNLPYDVQRLAHELWDDVRTEAQRRVGLEDLHRVLRRLLSEQHMMYEEVWQRLTLPQRAVLRAAVLESGRELLGGDARARYRLGGASSVQAALNALVRQDLLSRDDRQYIVVDSLFREWVARKTY